MFAKIKDIPPVVAVEMPHGWEAIPTAINGLPTRYVTVDQEGALIAWATPTAPTLSGPEGCKAWIFDTDDLCTVCCDVSSNESYGPYAESLRQISYQ
jgi:hypothetical protein